MSVAQMVVRAHGQAVKSGFWGMWGEDEITLGSPASRGETGSVARSGASY